ncbi:Staphylococcus nuclease (SNase) domain [Microbacterium esteraromaticum]|uniref:Staphylococcus nuclease (SNase) domain n=1 Tax=Microbacterium esteraromaticum TaxID=57043 RepID=A0A1R4IZJ9_9MICO|nr:thermonuclease family protein [Microbacterium esteraromaticum]SJN25300.1 Staphylococcus nuclease (SNase) domain [Microbacterium esteraromaticum]
MTTRRGTRALRTVGLAGGILGVIILGVVAVVGILGAVQLEHQPEQSETGEVVAVVDGDTIDVQLSGTTERVRIIGIDTPEIGRDAGEVTDCYAEEARTFLDELLYGHTVELRTDSSQQAVDDYGRLLRHVYIDGQNAALAALSGGVGVEYTYAAPYAGQTDYRAAESTARDEQLGLWGACPR